MNITIDRNGTRFGPYTLDQIKEYVANGTFNENDWAWYEGCTDWVPVKDVISLLTPPPPPLPPQSKLPPPPPPLPKLPPLPTKVYQSYRDTFFKKCRVGDDQSNYEEFLKLGPDGWARLLSEGKQQLDDLEQKRLDREQNTAIEEKAQAEGEQAGRNAHMWDEIDSLNPYTDSNNQYPQPNPYLQWKVGFSSGWDKSPNNTEEKIKEVISKRVMAPTPAVDQPTYSTIKDSTPHVQIHVLHNGEKKGPYSEEVVRQYLQQGSLLPNDLAWHDGLDGWVALSEIIARTNGLGMKFVPAGTDGVLFGIWDVRVKDFKAFVDATGYDATEGMESLGRDGGKARGDKRGDTWKNPGFTQTENDPVVGVSWEDAKAFCQWLTKKEQAEGRLAANEEYRLPSDAEWSKAVGLNEKSEGTPRSKLWQLDFVYPWGSGWPPPAGAGNYAGDEAKDENWPSETETLAGYNDSYSRTSPVGSFKSNSYGLYDMGGNIWQWCGDWYDRKGLTRVVRGGSWFDASRLKLLSAYREDIEPGNRGSATGFRVVVGINKPGEDTWNKLNEPLPSPSDILDLMGKVSLPFLISILPDNLFFCDRDSLSDDGVTVAMRSEVPSPFKIALPKPGIMRFLLVKKRPVNRDLLNKINQDLVYCRCYSDDKMSYLCFAADMLIYEDTSSDSIIMFLLSCSTIADSSLKMIDENPTLQSTQRNKKAWRGGGCLMLLVLLISVIVVVAVVPSISTKTSSSNELSDAPINPSAQQPATQITAPTSIVDSSPATPNTTSSIVNNSSDNTAKEPPKDTNTQLVSQSSKLTDLYRNSSDNRQLIALYDDNTFSCDDPNGQQPKVYGRYDRLQYGGLIPGTGRSIVFNATFGPVSGEGVVTPTGLDFYGNGNGAKYDKVNIEDTRPTVTSPPTSIDASAAQTATTNNIKNTSDLETADFVTNNQELLKNGAIFAAQTMWRDTSPVKQISLYSARPSDSGNTEIIYDIVYANNKKMKVTIMGTKDNWRVSSVTDKAP